MFFPGFFIFIWSFRTEAASKELSPPSHLVEIIPPEDAKAQRVGGFLEERMEFLNLGQKNAGYAKKYYV